MPLIKYMKMTMKTKENMKVFIIIFVHVKGKISFKLMNPFQVKAKWILQENRSILMIYLKNPMLNPLKYNLIIKRFIGVISLLNQILVMIPKIARKAKRGIPQKKKRMMTKKENLLLKKRMKTRRVILLLKRRVMMKNVILVNKRVKMNQKTLRKKIEEVKRGNFKKKRMKTEFETPREKKM